MADRAAEAVAVGGSHPSETGMGATGAAPDGGGKAVPDDAFLMGGNGTLGDTGSLDDGAGNSGDSLEEEARAVAAPQAFPSGSRDAQGGDAPAGGLSGARTLGQTGTIGGAPTGTTP